MAARGGGGKTRRVMTRQQSVKAICMLEAVAFAGMCAVGCWGGLSLVGARGKRVREIADARMR